MPIIEAIPSSENIVIANRIELKRLTKLLIFLVDLFKNYVRYSLVGLTTFANLSCMLLSEESYLKP